MRLNALFDDHMVVQAGIPLRLAGFSTPRAPVSIKLTGAARVEHQQTKADESGHWQLVFEPPVPGGAYEFDIHCDSQHRVIRDVQCGEVWLCAGQSNMAMTVAQALHAQQEIAAAHHPAIRCFTVAPTVAATPRQTVSGRWLVCSPETVGGFSAVGYFFARELQKSLPSTVIGQPCPIGIINASWGDTTAEAWTSREALAGELDLAPLLNAWDEELQRSPDAVEDLQPYYEAWRRRLAAYEQEHVAWLQPALEARLAGKPIPAGPPRPTGLGDNHAPTVLYNAMIAPLTSFPMRGVCWYQGESNAIAGRSRQYSSALQALIQSWRAGWSDARLPFLLVQLANHKDVRAPNPETAWPELREAQRQVCESTPHTAMVVAIDAGEASDIHPKNKQVIGERLAAAARGLVYGQPVAYQSPSPCSLHRHDGRLQIDFIHGGSGLQTRDGQPARGFEVAGNDGVFYPTTAHIEGDSVTVESEQVLEPLAVRYAWSDDPDCNLCNIHGLPMTPFLKRVSQHL